MRMVKIAIWLLLSLICIIGEIIIWIGSKVGGILIPLFAVLIVAAIVDNNGTAIFVFACTLVFVLMILFSVALITGNIKRIRNTLNCQ